ncbi:hypothetical protein BGZ99_009457 [Dissophora globulifera]|uniref:Uncharacterized protein n=1 Tax=Dissophora globulifera TaxID=979702 RepID=A0A9P6R9B7_9FUNG|nr:hypothetical protein BGZ99_009457 [Dissophora globulifera]
MPEFFEQYGGMVLMLLYFLKYGDDPEKRPSVASSEVSAETAAQQQQHHHQKYRGRQDSKEADSGITRVMGISRLRQSDLPDSIAQDVEDKFNKMIAFLEGLQALAAVTQPSKSEHRLQQEEHDSNPDSPSDPSHDEINDPNDLNGSDDFADRLQGLTSLADLHRLYSFIGLANLQTRLQSSQPQLGNLYRISNVRGQVSWVCVYHYRWTFLERNIDEFDQWVVKRRCGYFDKPSGSVSIRLFSRSHARTFCSWISNKVAPSIVEAHIEMGWKFGHKDLERLAKALASSTVTVLSLDGGSFAEKSSSSSFSNSSSPTTAPKAMATATYKMILYTKKYDPILYLLTHGQIHSLELTRFPGMFSKLSKKIVKASSLKRLELGRGMQVESKDRGAFIHFLASCTSLQELILPGCYVSDLLMHAILKGIQHNSNRATFLTSASTGVSLSMLDLSNSQFDDSAAIVLAQGLFNTNISNLDLSKNGMLSDTGAARVIRAVGPRLVSLKMAQTGFGDLAAAALAKSMDGISITTVLRDQLNLQQRLDFVAMAAGHRPGLRIISDNPIFAGHGSDMASPPPAREVRREKTHRTGHLIYLDIEDNQCTIQGFKLLANIKSRLYLVYLNISGSKDLPDRECAQILERVMSSAMVTLRLACTGFGNQSARALAKTLLEPPPRFGHDVRRSKHHPSRLSNLEELDLQACSIGFEGLSVLCDAMERAQVSACLQIMDLGHCGYLHDQVLQQLVTTLIIPNGTTWIPPIPAVKRLSRGDLGSRAGSEGGSKRIQMRKASRLEQQEGSESSDKRETREEADQPIFLHARSDTDPTGQVDTPNHGSTVAPYDPNDPTKAMPPRTVMMRPRGFFSNLRHLDLKSTRAGDGTAWLLAQALVQPDAMLTTLMVIDPIAMTVQGMHWIMDALCENTSVEEFGIGKTADVDTLTDLEVFGLGIVNLMELNKRIRSLTLLGAPMGSVAKGLLLNQSLHSLYLIRSRGQFEDLQLMGQALGFTRSLLVFWMDGSEKSLLGPLIQQQRQRQGRLEGSSEAEQDDLWATPMVADTIDGSPTTLTSNILQQQYQQHQQLQEEQQHENMYRDFHLFHNQEDSQQQSSQDSRRPHHHRLWQHRRRQDRLKEQQRQHHQVPQHTAWMHSFTNNVGSLFKHAWPSRTSDGRSKERPTAREESRTTAASATIPTMQRSRTISGAAMTTRPGHLDANGRVMTMAAAAYGGGGSWNRHPVIEGVRRNHSLVKVVLDTSISFPLSNTLAESPSNVGGGGTITRMSSRNAVSQQYQQQDFVPPQDLQQFQTQQQQLLQNKIMTNRKLLRERARVGWEELKLAGIDDDIIQEVLETDIA